MNYFNNKEIVTREKKKKKNHEINKQNKFPKIRQNHDDVFAATATK